MYNDRLSMEEARERIAQRRQEVETYERHQQLGFRDHRAARWIMVFAVLVIAIVVVGLFL